MTLYFDFETHDPDIEAGRGPGWPFGTTRVLGMGYAVNDGPLQYTEDMREILTQLRSFDTWVAHNISYELGIAKMLDVDFHEKNIFCTKAGAYLEDSTRLNTSLEALAKEMGLEKDQERFGRFVIERGLIRPRHIKSDPDGLRSATRWAMSNLHVVNDLAPDLVSEYCKSDVNITRLKHTQLMSVLDTSLYMLFSEVNKPLIAMRSKGMKIDFKKIKPAWERMTQLINDIESQMDLLAPGINYRSSAQLNSYFESQKVHVPKTDKGNPNIDNDFLSACDHPVAQLTVKLKQLLKARDEFLTNLEFFTHKERLHGEMVLFGAPATGRFSHRNPNLSQIPSGRKDKETSDLIRELFIPDEGEELYEMDLSAQEPRLIIHFSALCQDRKVTYESIRYDNGKRVKENKTYNLPMLNKLVESYNYNPELDSHEYNKDLINEKTGLGITRSEAKTIALGKAYGMGTEKLKDSLKIDSTKAKTFIDAFYSNAPYIQATDDYCRYVFKKFGGIKTLLGRVIKYDGFDHKALNKKIQGSAADQMCAILLELYKNDIIPQMVIHDSIVISATPEIAEKTRQIMENAVQLKIPMKVGVKCGPTWKDLVKVKEKNGKI